MPRCRRYLRSRCAAWALAPTALTQVAVESPREARWLCKVGLLVAQAHRAERASVYSQMYRSHITSTAAAAAAAAAATLLTVRQLCSTATMNLHEPRMRAEMLEDLIIITAVGIEKPDLFDVSMDELWCRLDHTSTVRFTLQPDIGASKLQSVVSADQDGSPKPEATAEMGQPAESSDASDEFTVLDLGT